MDWFTPWPNEALVAVSNYFLSDFPMVCSAEVKASVVTTMGLYHDKVSDACESYFERFAMQILFLMLHCKINAARFVQACPLVTQSFFVSQVSTKDSCHPKVLPFLY